MNKMIKGLALFLTIICAIQTGNAQHIDQKLQLSFSTGYQREDFHWSIAGNTNGQNPNVLSELKWKNVSGEDYSAALQWNFWRNITLFAAYSRQNIRSGTVNDMDYNADNRTQPVYTGNFSDNKGNITAWSAGAGYMLFNNRLFSLIPFVGYGNSAQYLYLVDLSGQFPDLNSTYEAHWNGPFIKVHSSLKIWRALKLTADVTYNQVNYSAQGDWNLITTFQHPVSYSHDAKGYGINGNARLVYNLTRNIAVSAGYNYFNWQTGNGNDMLYLTSGQQDKTRLNGVFRNGFEIVGGVVLAY